LICISIFKDVCVTYGFVCSLLTGSGVGDLSCVEGVPGDLVRSHHLGPELIVKKYKERDMCGSEHRPQRPDIIEREVMGKRDEHHPPMPMPPSSMDPDMPEHYDLENASSIAPSDIDIVYHYKGFREAGANMRKYKASPPAHIPSAFHHKHQGTPQPAPSTHRHSPHHGSASFLPSRDSPHSVRPVLPPASRVDSPAGASVQPNVAARLQHQTTPLARLSPSSEVSSQQPRILTLQDISGKPLQSALLATTSSSGGVGKDALHSNSERSLNSPVTSQLSGRSSSASRKVGPAGLSGPEAGGQRAPSGGLTTEEIQRFNSHPRTSSLVSTLDAVSSSSGRVTTPHHRNHLDEEQSSTTTDESGNDSFTCSEIEYDNNDSVSGDGQGDLYPKIDQEGGDSGTGAPSKPSIPPPPPSYDGFDSSFRGSLSTLVASDDDLSTHMGGPLYRPPNGSPAATAALGWDYLLNWGPNFESLVGVFKDIAELPDTVNGRVPASLRAPSSTTPKPSEEYV